MPDARLARTREQYPSVATVPSDWIDARNLVSDRMARVSPEYMAITATVAEKEAAMKRVVHRLKHELAL